jgi:Ca2+-dependent lipid-binding protein
MVILIARTSSEGVRCLCQIHAARADTQNPTFCDSGGTSDPYVIVQVSNEKRKTKVIKKDLNPEWGEKFELVVNDVNDSLKVCQLYPLLAPYMLVKDAA